MTLKKSADGQPKAEVVWDGPDDLRSMLTPVSSLLEDPENVNTHDERSIDAIAASYAKYKQQRPVVIDSRGVVRAGNGQLVAARRLGWTHLAVVRSDLTGRDLTAFAIADNRTAQFSEFDAHALLDQLRDLERSGHETTDVGFDAEAINSLIKSVEQQNRDDDGGPDDGVVEEDRSEESRSKWGTAAGQLWVIPSDTTPNRSHRILCGDSTNDQDVARLMGDDRPTLVVTDPPYGVDFTRGETIGFTHRKKKAAPSSILGDNLKGEQQRAFVAAVFESLAVHVAAGASVYMFSAPMVEGCCSFFGMLDAGVHVQSQLIWNKHHFVLGRNDHHWKHEVCWYGWYSNGTHRWFGDRDKTTVIDCNSIQSTLHPNEKPVPIITGMVSNSSLPGEFIAEPFSGSGTTLVSAEKTGRICLAMVLDPKFVAVSLDRLAEMGLTPQLA